MGIKTYNPYTPSRRQMTGSDFSEITKTTPEKSLLESKKRKAGRNAQGKITVRHRGGGAKKKYRIIDFKRKKDGIPATVVGIEYDPNRSANIALICYADGEKAYILAPEGLTDGMTVMNGADAEVRVGNCLPLSEIPVGTQIHNIELYPGKGGQLVRSAGNSAQLMAKEGKYATLRLPSGEMRMVPIICRASIGVVGNGDHNLINIDCQTICTADFTESFWLQIIPANAELPIRVASDPLAAKLRRPCQHLAESQCFICRTLRYHEIFPVK